MVWQIPAQEVIALVRLLWLLFVGGVVVIAMSQFIFIFLPAFASDVGIITRDEAKKCMRYCAPHLMAALVVASPGCLLFIFSLLLLLLHPDITVLPPVLP